MSVAISPDGRTLATDMQGSIWTVPVAGGAMTAHHRRLQRRAPAAVVAGRPHHRVLRLSRRRLRHLGDQPRRLQSAQADVGHVRRSRADLLARRHPHRLLVRSRQPARQRLQHLDARSAQRRAQADYQGPERRLHADLVGRRQRDCLRLLARQLRIAVVHEPPIDGGAAGPQRQGRASRRAVVRSRRAAAVSRHRRAAEPLRNRRQGRDRQRERLRVPRRRGLPPPNTSTSRTARSGAARCPACRCRRSISPRR